MINSSSLAQKQIHAQIEKHQRRVQEWFCEMRKGYAFPFYMSFDVRDAGFKVAPVDANIYPAGFNNICPTDREATPATIDSYIQTHYGKKMEKICLLCEEHTSNLFYWDNVLALKKMLEESGRQVRLSIPKTLDRPITVKSASWGDAELHPFKKNGGGITVGDDFVPDLIISNNDFSDAQESWAQGLSIPVNPPRELGWYQRRKSTHFKYYNDLAKGFLNNIGIDDPWLLQVETDVLFDCDLSAPENRDRAAQKAQQMLDKIRETYKLRGIDQEPVLFIKNNSGTYGLAVAQVKSGDEILSWNSKARTKMKAAKGGKGVTELLFQEGIPSALTIEGHTCEPAIYMIGCELAGGFLRAHESKGPTESLNSPGAVYKRLCVTDLKVDTGGHPFENVYGWVSKISSLAVGREAREMGVVFTEFNMDGSCCKDSLKS